MYAVSGATVAATGCTDWMHVLQKDACSSHDVSTAYFVHCVTILCYYSLFKSVCGVPVYDSFKPCTIKQWFWWNLVEYSLGCCAVPVSWWRRGAHSEKSHSIVVKFPRDADYDNESLSPKPETFLYDRHSDSVAKLHGMFSSVRVIVNAITVRDVVMKYLCEQDGTSSKMAAFRCTAARW